MITEMIHDLRGCKEVSLPTTQEPGDLFSL